MLIKHLLPFFNSKQLFVFRTLNSLFHRHISSLSSIQDKIKCHHTRLYHIERANLYLPHRIKKIINKGKNITKYNKI
jgi:hypothetical protein